MDIREAIEIIRDLAEQNALDADDYEDDDILHDEALRQDEAFSVLDNYVKYVLC
jgi:hypothetical protein